MESPGYSPKRLGGPRLVSFAVALLIVAAIVALAGYSVYQYSGQNRDVGDINAKLAGGPDQSREQVVQPDSRVPRAEEKEEKLERFIRSRRKNAVSRVPRAEEKEEELEPPPGKAEPIKPAPREVIPAELPGPAKRKPPVLPGTVRLSGIHKPTGPTLRYLRAIEVLEHLGTADAKQVLLTLVGGAPRVLVTREAKASLDRMVRK